MASTSQPLAYTYASNPIVPLDGTYVSYSPGVSGWVMRGSGWSPASGEPFWTTETGNWWMSPIYDDDLENKTGPQNSKYTRIIGVGGEKILREFAPGTLTWLHDQTVHNTVTPWGNALVNWTAAAAAAGTIVTNTGCFSRLTTSIGVTTLLGMGPITGVADGGPFGTSEWPITQGTTGPWASGLVGTKIWPQGVGGDPLYEPGTVPSITLTSVKGKRCLFTVDAVSQMWTGAVDPTTGKVFDGWRLDVTWDPTSDPGECGNGTWGPGDGIMPNQFVSIINVYPYTATIQGNANFHFYGVVRRDFPTEAQSLAETARLAVKLGIPGALVTDTYAQIKTKAQATVGFWTSW